MQCVEWREDFRRLRTRFMKKLLIILFTSLCLYSASSNAAKLEDFLDRKEIQRKIKESIADQDINFGVDIFGKELINGINASSKYNFSVEASNHNKLYTRVDKWDLNLGINVGTILKDLVDVPFSFSINRNNSLFFVRQFHTKLDAVKAIPYTPAKLPLNADLALKNLKVGDFVSMPANLSVAVNLSASTVIVSPVIVNANTGIYYVVSGEFTVQVYKLDDSHVRLKLISKRGRDNGGTAGVGISFNLFGLKIIDNQIDRLLERDLAQVGISYNPGAQFIVDYIFDLKNPEAKDAYNKILSSTFKFRDLIVSDIIDASDLKDKLISSYEKADSIYDEDKNLDPKDRRVQRIFKGFDNYRGHTRHLKFSMLITGYTKDRTFTESRVTFIDKNEKNLEFFYPTYSKYVETHMGKWLFELKDQNFQNNFGLIPIYNAEDSKLKNPDIGLTFERKDRYFTKFEQKSVVKFMVTEIPDEIVKNIDFSEWRDGVTKLDSRIFLHLVLKGDSFPYLKNIPLETMKEKLLEFIKEKSKYHILDENADDANFAKIKDFLLINRFIEKERVINLAASITEILKTENAEEMTKKLVALNEFGLFDKVGLGFLISLLPQDKLADLVYVKLEVIAKNLKPINAEFGTLKYRVLYNELNQIQSRLSNRSNDLTLSDDDRNIEDTDIEALTN